MAGLIRLNNLVARVNRGSNLLHSQLQRNAFRSIATSSKNKEAVAAPASATESVQSPSTKCGTGKNWVSYGFDFRDEAQDRSAMRASYFFSITLCLVWGTFIWAYLPDPQLRDWAQREGHLALRAREANGVDPISPHYINPQLISLPSEAELEGVEIII